jgi:hypothetical protein
VPVVNARPSTGLSGCEAARGGDADAGAAAALDVIEVGEVAAGGAGPKSSAAAGAGVSKPANIASQSWAVFAGRAADGALVVLFAIVDAAPKPEKLLDAVAACLESLCVDCPFVTDE